MATKFSRLLLPANRHLQYDCFLQARWWPNNDGTAILYLHSITRYELFLTRSFQVAVNWDPLLARLINFEAPGGALSYQDNSTLRYNFIGPQLGLPREQFTPVYTTMGDTAWAAFLGAITFRLYRNPMKNLDQLPTPVIAKFPML